MPSRHELYKEVKAVVDLIDPISTLFTPDEYDSEIHDLVSRIMEGQPVTTRLVNQVFVHCFSEGLVPRSAIKAIAGCLKWRIEAMSTS